jgi:hypothetical protein
MASNSPLPPSLPAPFTYAAPTRWDRAFIGLFVVGLLLFACAVEKRSCFMQRRMTDAGCFFRGAWAVRSGADMYGVLDDNDWHYNYPPFFAIVMTPFADAPAGMDHSGELPYPVSIGLWFLINLAALVLAVHWLVTTVERGSPDPWVRNTPRGCQAWWRRRMLPVLLCLPPAAHSLMRGQVNLVVLLMYTGMIVNHCAGRRFKAGLFLAIPMSIKVIPTFLLVYPLWRRDFRMLAGVVAALMVTLVLLPGLVLGPERAVQSYVSLFNAVLCPGLTEQGGDGTRSKELTNVTSTDNQSFVAVMHCTLYPDQLTRPANAPVWLRLGTLATGGLLTLLTLLAAPRPSADGCQPAAQGMLAWGLLLLTMLFCSPMSHSHYYCWCLPLVTALAVLVPPRGAAWYAWVVLGPVFVTCLVLPHLPWTNFLREFGVVTYAGVALWGVGLAVLTWRSRPAALVRAAQPDEVRQPLAA